jgi:plasmid stabilization system protein ParE
VSPVFTIRYLSTAQRDLVEILEYIKKDRPGAPSGLLEKFDKSIAALASNAYLGTIPKDERLKRLGYRVLVVDKYLISYVLKPKTVQIRRVIHGERRYSFLL